jgi:hypothetical protein
MQLGMAPVVPRAAAQVAQGVVPDLDADIIGEFPVGHPWHHMRVADAVAALGVDNPAAVVALEALPSATGRRLLLHAFGVAIAKTQRAAEQLWTAHVSGMHREQEAAIRREVAAIVSFAPKGADIMQAGALQTFVGRVESECPVVMGLMRVFVVSKSTYQNRNRGPDWKMRRVVFPLLQIIRTRSQEFSGVALLHAIYLFYLGVTERANMFLHYTVTVTSETMRSYFKAFIEGAGGAEFDAILRSERGFCVVVDNVNIMKHVGEPTADRRNRMLNLTAGFVFSLPVVDVALSRVRPSPLVALAGSGWRSLLLSRVERDALATLVRFEVRDALVALELGGMERVERHHVGPFDATPWAPLTALELNSATMSDCVRILRAICKETGCASLQLAGDALTIRIMGAAQSHTRHDTSEPMDADLRPGLFHWMWNAVLGIIWSQWWDELKRTAEHIHETKLFKKATKTYGPHDRLVFVAFPAHVGALWDEWVRSGGEGVGVDSFWVWLYDGMITSVDVSPIAHRKRFVVMMASYIALRNAVRFNDGEAIVLLMRFYLPYQAGLTSASMILPQTIAFLLRVQNSSPFDRAQLLGSLCVNTGRAGHAVALDMHMEHLVCMLKRLVKRNMSNFSAELLAHYSKILSLLCFVEREVDDFWKPKKPTTYRTCRDMSVQVQQIRKSELRSLHSALSTAASKSTKKFGAVAQTLQLRIHKMVAHATTVAPGGQRAGDGDFEVESADEQDAEQGLDVVDYEADFDVEMDENYVI